ncbi:Fic family protein [Changpingibacter yushuensis]|uniref:Fic family protein n=1 Tax=Changpingibacter yushuensis TaxID=2758440 RepID=UPI001C70B0FB|nr:Fic family protein [Changpingibacter yushuensis]
MSESEYKPPFTMSDEIVDLVSHASYELGRASVMMQDDHSVHLRRQNRIRTVHSSLAIEHNTLTLGQVTAILDGKRVLGDPREICEVKNAFDAYDLLVDTDPMSVKDLLAVHHAMMDDLAEEAGMFRTQGVGIFDGDQLVHMVPPAEFVAGQISDLIAWYGESTLPPLVKSAVFHYEFEFIHPFQDGNGRMGRFWHTALLGRWNPVFYWLPVEELIQKNQQGYYDALGTADAQADSSGFVEFMLGLFVGALEEVGSASEHTAEVSVPDAALVSKHTPDILAELGRSWPELADVLYDLSEPDRQVLAYLHEHGPSRPAEISSELQIPSRSLQRINGHLTELGLVQAQGKSSGRRYSIKRHGAGEEN